MVLAYGYDMVQMVLRMVARRNRTTEMVRALRSLMLPLQAAPGFISCRLYVEADSPDSLCYVEEWRTEEDVDQQIRSDHCTRLLALMEEAVEQPDFQLHWVADVKGLEYLEAVRSRRP
jgi:quinol monooxygenase YgiN